jgi:hypothetical protein
MNTYVVDCAHSKGTKTPLSPVLDKMVKEGLVTVVKENNEIGQLLYKIAQSVLNKTADPTLLVIMNQDKIYAIKENIAIEGIEDTTAPTTTVTPSGKPMMGSRPLPFSSGQSTAKKNDISTYRNALQVILESGPNQGVNTIITLKSPKNLLGIDPNRNMITRMFKHFVILKSEQRSVYDLGLDDVAVNRLTDIGKRLRAIYYSAEDSECRKFIPFIIK